MVIDFFSFALGVACVCHGIGYLPLHRKYRHLLHLFALLGAIIGAFGYFGKAFVGRNEQHAPPSIEWSPPQKYEPNDNNSQSIQLAFNEQAKKSSMQSVG